VYFYRAHYYSPVLERFASEDPLGISGSGPNSYAYASNAPANWRDALGTTSPDGYQIPLNPREKSNSGKDRQIYEARLYFRDSYGNARNGSQQNRPQTRISFITIAFGIRYCIRLTWR
jgi:uncharacterized protein RhaS with RHS repeats